MELFKEFIEYFAIALVASAALIFGAKVVLDSLIRRDIGYYENEEIQEEHDMLVKAGILTDDIDLDDDYDSGKEEE